jgi:hypothetical protein
MQSLKCVFVLLFITTCLGAQNVLVFENVKDSFNLYLLPLGKFPVQLKLRDTAAFKVIIDNVTDSVLQVRTYKSSNAIDSTIRKLRADYEENLSKQKHKRRHLDSLRTELDARILAAQYSTRRNIYIPRIKTLTIFNRYFPEKKKQLKLANAATIVFIAATLFSASTQNPYYIGAGIGLTAISAVAKSVLATRDLDLIVPKKSKRRKQWRIKGIKPA